MKSDRGMLPPYNKDDENRTPFATLERSEIENKVANGEIQLDELPMAEREQYSKFSPLTTFLSKYKG